MDPKFEAGPEPAAAGSRQDKLARVHALLGEGAALAPATAAQERFWVLAHAGGDGSFYHVAEAVEVVGDLDYDRLERCLGSLIERHETLRTSIATLQGRPIQIILPRVVAPLIRLSPVAGRPVEATLREWALRPFDLARAPLWRMAVMPVASGQHAVLVVFHHLISDGWSLAIFLREVLQLYTAELEGARAELAPALQYREYWVEQAQARTVAREEAQLNYWTETLRDLPKAPTLPFDSARPTDGEVSGAWLPFELGARGEQSARLLARAGETTLFGVFMAAFNAMLHALSGERDLLVGTVVSGRHGRREWETVLGPLINSLVLRTHIDETESFAGFIRRSRVDLLQMLAHQDLPFDRIVEFANVPRRTGMMPLTQVGIVYHEYPVRAPHGLPMTLHPLPFDTGRAQLDLSLVILNEDGRLRCRFEYDSRLFREETVRMARNVFVAILLAAGAQPESTVKQVCRAAFPEMQSMHLTRHMRQIWQGEQIFGDPLLYRNTVLYTIPKPLDEHLFIQAADFVVRHTDGLRVYVEPNAGHPRLRFAAPAPGVNTFRDFSREADPESAFHAWLEEELTRPSDLENAPFRTDLARLGTQKYVWHISHHHMFSDGRSVMILVERVSEVYGLLVLNRFEPDRIKYPQLVDQLSADFEYERSSRLRKDAAYWAKRLDGVSEAISFYGRAPRKASTLIDRVPCRIGAQRSARLRAMASLGMTEDKGPDAFLCNVFGVILAVYLHKVSGGVSRIVFGSVNHNRRTPESRNIIGLYMQVIPHVLEIGEGETFRSLMRKMDREIQASLRYGQYTVESTVGSPTYDVLLNYHKEVPVHFDGVQADYEVIVRRATQSFGVNITNYDLSDDLELQFDFHRDVFAAEKYPQAMAHFVAVIDAMLEKPDALLTSVCLLGSEERRHLLEDFNATAVPFRLGDDFHTAFESAVAARPDEICASDANGSITYAGLLASSDALARRLVTEGALAGSVVPILAERGIPFLEALLAVFRLGAVYLPLDKAAPAERTAHILRECEASMVIVEPALCDNLPEGLDIRRVTLGRTPEAPRADPEPAGMPFQPRDTQRLAYIIYTSGSTGRPKGAMVTERGMMNHLLAKVRDLALGPSDVIVQNASQCFDISIWQFLSGLISGARTLIVPERAVLDPEAFVALLEREGATIVEVVPSYLRVLLDHWDRQPGRAVLPAVRCLVATGEALPPDLVRRWLQRKPGVPLVNAYGPTECSDDVSHHFLRSAPEPWEHTIPIGKPIANTQLYVLDSGLQPVPTGVQGELFVGGDGVGLGYLGDDSATRKAFIVSPLPEARSARLYRTGDRASFRDDGCLEFHGRLDHQVKLRGYRIELGEIEAALRAHAAVANAVVVLRAVRGVDALVAYVELLAQSSVDETTLSMLAASKLPSYMVPRHWVFVSQVPLTPNGKTDHASLPEPTLQDSAPELVASLTDLERELAGIWEAVLERPVRDPNADFFALGGDSLRAIQTLSLASSHGKYLRMPDFLARPTLRGMAASLGINGAATAVSINSAPTLDPPGEVPLLPVQARFFEGGQGDPAHDNVSIWVSLDARLAPHAEAALSMACAERDAFRLRFLRTGQGWKQFLGSETVPPLFVRKRLERAADGEARLAVWANETQRSLNLERGELAAGLLVEDAMPGRALLLVTIHHLITDGVSARLMLGRVDEILTDLGEGRLPRAWRQSGTSSFAAYARGLRRAIDAGAFDDQRAYWQAIRIKGTACLLAEIPKQNLVADQRVLVARVPSRQLGVDGDAGSFPQGVAHAALAAFVRALGRWHGSAAYAVVIVGTGREWAPPGLRVEGTLGWLNSFYPVVFEVSGRETARDVSQYVRERLDAVPMGGFGYGILRYLHPDQTIRGALEGEGDAPITFNYLGRLAGTDQGLQIADLDRGAPRSSGNTRLAWLQAECWDAGESIGLRLDFHRAFPEASIAQLMAHWQQGLLALAGPHAMQGTGT